MEGGTYYNFVQEWPHNEHFRHFQSIQGRDLPEFLMKAISAIEYFYFGVSIRYLQENHSGRLIHGENNAICHLQSLFYWLKTLQLHVSERVAESLEYFYCQLLTVPKDAVFTFEQAKELSSLIAELRTTLEAELQDFAVYAITPKRIDEQKLLHNVSALFSTGTLDNLSDIVRYDLNEAGKCTVYERPTAAAFHLMRATEATLRAFYVYYVPQGRQTLWGGIIRELRASSLSQQREYATLFDHLDHVRKNFRNPTQHPEAIYDIEQVQDLWGVCIDAISRMAKDIT